MIGTRSKGLCAALLVAAGIGGSPGRAPAADNAARIEPIVVTATRIEQKASEQASSVSVVTREDIEIADPSVAGDVLRDIPGVVVQRQGGPGNLENIRIRGGAATQTLVMIDGFPVNSPTLGSFDISTLPADGFERVEIVRGAQSALYGSNAMGGVVNFIPRKGLEGTEVGAGISVGSFETAQGGAHVQGGGPRRSLFLDATGFRSDGILPNDRTELVSFLGAAETQAGARSRVHAIVLSTGGHKEVPIDFGAERDVNHTSDRRGFLSGLRVDTGVTRTVTVSVSGMIFDEWFHNQDPADPGEPFPFVFDDLTKTRKMDLRVMAKYSPGTYSTTFVGAEYEKDRATDANRTNFGDTDVAASTYNRSVFVQEELRPWKRTGISVGARLDSNSEAGTEFNPKAAVYYEFVEGGPRVRAAAGRGFRVPTILEKRDPSIGNETLSAEVVRSYEAGTDIPFWDRRAKLSGTYFYQQFSNLIQFDSSVPGPAGFGQLRNLGHAFSRGVEAEASVRPIPEAEALLSYTYADTWDGNGKRILGTPRHRGTASILATPVPAVQARLDWRVESDQLDAPLFSGKSRRPGFAVVDLFAKYRWEVRQPGIREIALTGKVQNLFNRNYEERLDNPAPGINFLAGAELKI